MNSRPSRNDRLFTFLFAVLLSIQVLYLAIGFASLPRYYHRVTTHTIEPVMYYGQVQISNELVAQMAAERGLSLRQYATYRIVFSMLAALVPLLVAAVIVRRARWQWFAWFTAFIIVFLGESALAEQTLVSQFVPLEVFGINALFWFLVLPYLFLFPNGKPVPSRVAWLVGALVIYHFLIQVGTVTAYVAPDLATRLKLPNWGQNVYNVPVLLNFLVILASQVYRHLRVSTAIERQQTKWFLFGFVLIVALIPAAIVSDTMERGSFLSDITGVALWMPLYFGLAIAILRYRLWDIDVIIRKTLVYGALTVLLALVYFGGVVLLQRLVGALTGVAQSPLAVAVSTLVIVVLFTPLRLRIQDFIDRRFFRKKYDAQLVLARFALTARDETDLESLTGELARVVQDTLQPEGISVWLKRDTRY